MTTYYGDDDLGTRFEADQTMAALGNRAARATRIEKRGGCAHGWIQGALGKVPSGPVDCLRCKKHWNTWEEFQTEREDLFS